ncbi:MAG: arogenate dehydrogenase [uncultured bacterium]|nr:MAG: arogenate dehydrogenase [uncultured bacterium]HBH17684.1 arogenate dehydrogenase [Cyanobacteria bacterium UBA9579]
MPDNPTIAVIGLGLIGGSILKALRPKGFHLIGISRSEETVRKAINLDLADEYSTNVELVQKANVVFICTPINKTIETIDKVRKIVSPDCIITDVASLKGFIMDYVNDYDFPTNFIGGHPMAGTENTGIDYAVDNLFEGAKWVLTPSRWSGAEDIRRLEELTSLIGAKSIIADAYEHDKAVTLISHLPLLLSQSLFGMVSDYPDENIKELALKLAASGFRDTTRLAATNPELAKDILLKNKAYIREAVNGLKDYLTELDKALDLNEEEFMNLVKSLASKRKDMYSPEGKNTY